MPRIRHAAPVAALVAALATTACRTPRTPPAPAPSAPASPRLAEGVNTISFVAAEPSLLHRLALARNGGALVRSARAGVSALRATCAPSAAPAGAVAAFCGNVREELDALSEAVARSDPEERLRAAARAVVEVMLADLALAPGRTAAEFLRLAVARSVLGRVASDAGWRELRNAPVASVSRALVDAADALDEACATPAPAPGWDCARLRAPLDALRAAGEAGTVGEGTRAVARDVLAALPPAGAR